MKIGVLHRQECFQEHLQAIEKYGLEPLEIREPVDLDRELQGLIIPGEKSAEFDKLLDNNYFLQKIKEKAERGLVIYGINAGVLILWVLGLMNICVERKSSKIRENFELNLIIPALGEEPVRVEFSSQAPCISGVKPNVGILCSVDDDIVMARQGNYLVSTFNPKFIEDLRVHEYFFRMVKDAVT